MKPGELDLATGELVLDVELEADMYRPHGPCETGCGHPATTVWDIYPRARGNRMYEFRCACCCVLGRLERSRWHASQIAKLEGEYAKAREKCK